MITWVEPEEANEARRVWRLGAVSATASRVDPGAGWRCAVSWRPEPLVLRGAPHVGLRLGAGHTVAHLAEPVWLAPGEQAEVWLCWPLAVVVAAASGAVFEEHRPRARKTLLGRVDGGEVFPALRCASLAGPDAPRDRVDAALRATLHNRSALPVSFRRFPVAEPALGLARGPSGLVAGAVVVSVFDGGSAEAKVVDAPWPEGFVALPRGATERGFALKLDWLLDATRRSTEFQL